MPPSAAGSETPYDLPFVVPPSPVLPKIYLPPGSESRLAKEGSPTPLHTLTS